MSAIDFPASPTVGQAFAAGNGVIYVWNGLLWLASGASAGGDIQALSVGVALPTLGVDVQIPFSTVTIGNAGGWFSTSTNRYTPPAGRYFLQCSSYFLNPAVAASVALKLRKNGVVVAGQINASGAASVWLPLTLCHEVDANGTDFFDWVGLVTQNGAGAVVQAVFSAFPISGIKGPPGDLANVPGADAGCKTTPLGANVLLNNTGIYFNGPNTGLIGASGQKWRISAKGGFSDASSPVQYELRLFDGTAAVPNTSSLHTQGTGGAITAITTECIVTLTGPATFTAQGRDFNFASGNMLAANTSITAERLT